MKNTGSRSIKHQDTRKLPLPQAPNGIDTASVPCYTVSR